MKQTGKAGAPTLLRVEQAKAVDLAWDALARYKFWMFGYYAARAVYLGQLLAALEGGRPSNPFAGLVAEARLRQKWERDK